MVLCSKNVLNAPCTDGGITGNVVDGDYVWPAITVNSGDIVSMTDHKITGNNYQIGGFNEIQGNVSESICFGEYCTIEGNSQRGLCMGWDSNIGNLAGYCVSLGAGAECYNQRSVAIGESAICEGVNDGKQVAIGYQTTAGDEYCVAVGSENWSSGSGCVAAGYNNYCIGAGSGWNSVVGNGNRLYGDYSILIGGSNNLGNVINGPFYSVGIGENITINDSQQLVLGGNNQFNNVFVNNLGSTATTSGYASVLYDTSSKEIVYCPNNSGVHVDAGTVSISGTGSVFYPCVEDGVNFSPKKIDFTMDVGISTGSGQYMSGTWTPNKQWSNNIYVQGATNIRSTNNSNAISVSTNGSTYSDVANVSSTISGFAVNCTTYGSNRSFNYSVIG